MDTVWTDICAHLRQQIDTGQYKVWIAPLAGYRVGNELVLHARSDFVAGFVRERFQRLISDAASAVLEKALSVRVTCDPVPADRQVKSGDTAVDGEPEAYADNKVHATPVSVQEPSSVPVSFLPTPRSEAAPQSGAFPRPGVSERQMELPLRMPEFSLSVRSWRHSFDEFVVGPSNELAFAASRSMCHNPKGADLLFLSSSAGLGKTHLMQAVGQQLYRDCNSRMPRIEYLTAEEFTSQLVMAFKTNDTDRFKARYRDVEVLLLEDVHFLQGKEKMQEELLSTLKALQDRGSKIIFSSSFLPRELSGMSDQLLSRLSSGLLAAIDRPDKQTRKRIFKEKANSNHVLLSEDVSDFLADTIQSDVRQIESCLQNLILKAKLLKTDITMQLAWEAVQHYSPCKKSLDLENIIAYISQGYGVSTEQLRSKSRKREYVTARNTVFFLARKHTELSLGEIGTAFNRSHSTVIKGITTLEREISRESSIGRQMASAIALIERTGGIISPSF